MSLEYPVGTSVIHKSNREIRFVVINSNNINKIEVRHVDRGGYANDLIVDHRELQKISD